MILIIAIPVNAVYKREAKDTKGTFKFTSRKIN